MVFFAFLLCFSSIRLSLFAKQSSLYGLKINCMTFTLVIFLFFSQHWTNGRGEKKNYRFNAIVLYVRWDEVCANIVYWSCKRVESAYHRRFSSDSEDKKRTENWKRKRGKERERERFGCLLNNNGNFHWI